jgi:hypothetical protein
MNPTEVVRHEAWSSGCRVIFTLLGKTSRQARETADTHTQGKILALYKIVA